MNALLWVAVLLAVGLAVMVLEVFVPSGGVLGFLSLVAIIAAVVTAFVEQGATFGLSVLAITFMAVPAVLMLAFRWFPETPLGRRVLPAPPAPEDVLPGTERRRWLRGCVGRTGRVTAEMLPWGTIEIDGVSCEAIADGGPIPPATEVEVVGVQSGGLVVRPLARRPVADGPAAAPAETPARSDDRSPPPVSQVLEEFDFEDFTPPAA